MEEPAVSRRLGGGGLRSEDEKAVGKLCAPAEVQRGMISRFTTDNDVSKMRMLAVTRCSLETRFLFHARDTALFYGFDWDFFLENTSFEEVWRNTLQAQPYHDDIQETSWDFPLRYALAIHMGVRKIMINRRLPHGMVRDGSRRSAQEQRPKRILPWPAKPGHERARSFRRRKRQRRLFSR